MCYKYPFFQHAQPAQFLALYLLDYAPADLRDLKLARQAMLLAEQNARWERINDANCGSQMDSACRTMQMG